MARRKQDEGEKEREREGEKERGERGGETERREGEREREGEGDKERGRQRERERNIERGREREREREAEQREPEGVGGRDNTKDNKNTYASTFLVTWLKRSLNAGSDATWERANFFALLRLSSGGVSRTRDSLVTLSCRRSRASAASNSSAESCRLSCEEREM